MTLLSVRDLTVKFATRDSSVTALNRISFDLAKGERLGIVGESGAGKSITGFSLMDLLSRPGFIDNGTILFQGDDIVKMSESQMRSIRGNQVAMIFQGPMGTLNPVLTIGQQMVETLRAHRKLSQKEAEQIAIVKLREVYIPSPEDRLGQYPHELSGGMRQRIVIAIALLLGPQLIIADEPTTALDVTVQAQILQLFNEIKEEFNSSIIMITHDLGVVASVCDEVLVMYAGEAMEHGSLDDIFYRPHHPYTKGLLHSVPRPDQSHDEPLYSIPGNPPNLVNKKPGCPFAERCEYVQTICNESSPPLVQVALGHLKACHREDIA